MLQLGNIIKIIYKNIWRHARKTSKHYANNVIIN